MKSPKKWTEAELAKAAKKAIAAFRHERLDEPLEIYAENFKAYRSVFSGLIKRLPQLASPTFDVNAFATMMGEEPKRRAFLYLTAPPLSEDDLKTLADAPLTTGGLKADTAAAKRVRDIVFKIIDPHRFPWVIEDRDPTEEERKTAIVASCALVAARKVETYRRNEAKNKQENGVKEMLKAIGYEEQTKRKIPNASHAPKKRHFMGETELAGARADVVVTLPDGRIMAIECKVSNSAVNSYKRLVHDTGGKATIWHDQLGKANVLACAVLNGVFSVANCELVQNDKDVFLFWDHNLDDLKDFIEAQG